MLILRAVHDAQSAHQVFNEFKPDYETWLVSDLKSKLDLSRSLLHDPTRTRAPGFISSDAVVRASELWRRLLLRVRPDLQVISREFAMALIQDQLSGDEREWVHAPGVARVAFDYMTQLMPILSHVEGDTMIKTWFEAQPNAATRWLRWYELSVTLWRGFLESGFIASPWVSGVLINELNLFKIWSRPLWVDLGSALTQVEADLLALLSESLDVVVLCPEPEWHASFAHVLGPYQILKDRVGVRRMSSAENEFVSSSGFTREPRLSASRTFLKFTTMIAEVKNAVAQVREWLDSEKLAPREIAIVAPEIELYWPALADFFAQEGVPCQKDRVARLHSYADMMQWFANMRLRSGSIDEGDLEVTLFGHDETATAADNQSRAQNHNQSRELISFDRFKTLYAKIYSREDLARSATVAELFRQSIESHERVDRDRFIGWALSSLPATSEITRAEIIVKKVLVECPRTQALPLRQWLDYFQQLLSRAERVIEPGVSEGISFLNLSSAETSPARKMIVLGLSEKALRENRGTVILWSDLKSIENQFGFRLSSDEQSSLEYELSWLASRGDRDMIFSVAETDFEGTHLAPSWFWVRESESQSQSSLEHVNVGLTLPKATRWDELAHSSLSMIARERDWTELRTQQIATAMAEDRGVIELSALKLEGLNRGRPQRVSPSAIEDYLSCPFVYAARREFGLVDEAELDLEVDPSRRGSLMHALFEQLTIEPMRFDWSDAEIFELLNQARLNARVELADERLWPSLQTRYCELARRFLESERVARLKFPKTRTIARELSVAGFIRVDTGELVATAGDSTMAFSGRIDRVDESLESNANESFKDVVIYDYKSSANSISQYGRWIDNNSIQLLLYSMALEAGLSQLGSVRVLGAFYYPSRPMSRDTGFKVEDVQQDLFEPGGRKQNRLTLEQKKKLFDDGRARIKTAIDGIRSGQFAPKPHDLNECSSCRWRTLCRAPHLN